MNKEELIYQKLYELLPDLDSIREYRKMTAPGFMDLNLDVLEEDSKSKIIALSHYYKHPSGDMIPDPDMSIRIWKEKKSAEALTYQDLTRFDKVYYDENCFYSGIKKSLNSFLILWLFNLKEQGFGCGSNG